MSFVPRPARPGRWRLVAVASVMATLFVACGGEDLPKFPAAVAGTKGGGSFTVGISRPSSIEPSNAADASGQLVVRTMCDPLIQVDPVSGELVPAVAESWLVSDGGRRFTIKLRKGVRFSTGEEVTAEDAVFSLSRVASDEAASPLASLLSNIEGYDKVHGDDTGGDERQQRILKGTRVIGRHGFEITLVNANADFIRILTQPLASPVSKKAVEKDPDAFALQPVCAGPYRLESPWRPTDDTIRLARAERYKPVSSGYTAGGRGYADSIVFDLLSAPDGAISGYRSGQLDVARLPRTVVAGAEADAGAGADNLVRASGPSLEYIGLPTGTAPFDKPAVRLALSRALDRRRLVQAIPGQAGVPARGYLPPALGPVHRPEGCGDAAPVDGDVAGARAELQRAGVDLNGKSIELFFNDEFDHASVMNELARQWKEAFGLAAVVRGVPWEPYLNEARSAAGFSTPFRLSLTAPYPSADAYLSPLFESSSIGSDNFSRFADIDFDRVLRRVARRSGDDEDRARDYQRLEDMACQAMPVIPLDFAVSTHLVRRSKLDSARGPLTDIATGEVLLRELFVK